jgi:hypothetical protein
MKRRVRKIANFFAFNLLFFALYLNFIHKDESALNGLNQVANTSQPAAFSNTTVAAEKNTTNQAAPVKEETTALKLSIN